MIEIRPLREAEYSAAKEMMPGDAASPDWKNCWGIFNEQGMVGFFGMESRLIVEPLYMKGANHHLQAYGAMTWVDGFLRAIASQQGKLGYEFFVGDDHPQFQEFIDKHLPVTKGREKTGLYFFRRFEV
jgi:hypothetical protein